MKNLLVFLFSILLFTACKEKVDLEAEVIAIHDEVMPKMGDMHVARKQLRSELEKTADETVKAKILKMIVDLEDADEGMMSWMNEWKVPENEAEKIDYLHKEKEKITKVKIDMLSSLKKAHDFLAKSK